MRLFVLAALGLSLAACNQTVQSGAPVASAATPEMEASTDQSLPPIYEPLVDMHRVKPERYRKDLAECRQQAAPQEAAARQASQRQTAGNVLQVAGAVASFIPVSTFRQARVLANATDAAQTIGGATADGAAATVEQATADYALVVNTCLSHRRYRLLRE